MTCEVFAQPGIWKKNLLHFKRLLVHQNKQEVFSPLWVVSDSQPPMSPCSGVILGGGTTRDMRKLWGGGYLCFTILIMVSLYAQVYQEKYLTPFSFLKNILLFYYFLGGAQSLLLHMGFL